MKKRRRELTVFGKFIVTLVIVLPLITIAVFEASSANNTDSATSSEYTPRTKIYNTIDNEGREILAKLIASEPSLTTDEQVALVNIVFNNAEYMDCSVEQVILQSNHPFISVKDLSILKAKPKSRQYSLIQSCLDGHNTIGSALYFDYYATEQSNAIKFKNIQIY